MKRLLLIIDKRDINHIAYKEYIGWKWFIKPNAWETTKNGNSTKFIKTIRLYDPAIQAFRKQKVMCELISINKRTATIGVI